MTTRGFAVPEGLPSLSGPLPVGRAAARALVAEVGLPSQKSEGWRLSAPRRLFDALTACGWAAPGEGDVVGPVLPGFDALNAWLATTGETPGAVAVRRRSVVAVDGSRLERDLRGPRVDVVQIDVPAGATVDWVDVFRGDAPAFVRVAFDVGDGATVRWHGAGLGTGHVRVEVAARVGEGATFATRWAALAGPGARHDVQVHTHHVGARSVSDLVVRGVVCPGGNSTVVASVRVPEQVAGCDARQHLAHLLLGEGAVAAVEPRLDIACDEVACTHGATVGTLDEESRFFLRSRGLTDAAARELLVEAFVREVLQPSALDEAAAWLTSHVRGRP